MAGEVAEIEKAIGGENLARVLAGLYNQWWIQRNPKEAEWRELRNYLFATDTTSTSNSSLPWKNKTTLPKLTQIRDNLHANYMDALFPNEDWMKWEGSTLEASTMKKRRAIEAYMKTKLKEGGFKEVVSDLVADYIDYGNAFGEVQYVNESHTDEVTGEVLTTFNGPKLVRISPFDIVFNPIASSFAKSPKFTRYVKSVGELKKELDTRPDLNYDKGAYNKALEIRKAISMFRVEDVNKANAFIADGFGTLQEYYQSGMVEIIEFEGDFYDKDEDKLHENRIITIVDRSYVLRNISNPSYIGHDTKHHVGWRKRPDNLYGMGPLDNLVGMQYRLDHLENLKADALDLTIHPPMVIKGDVEPFTWGPETVIQLQEDGNIQMLPPNPAAFQVNNELAALMNTMEEMAGAPKEAMGMRTPGEKTAFEVQSLQNAAGRIFQNKINQFEIDFLEPVLNTMLETAKRNMSLPELAKVYDDDFGVQDFLSVTKEDLTSRGKIRPVGARHYAARAQLLQNILGVFNSPIGQMIAPHISPKNLAIMVEEYMGFEKYNFVKDNAAIFEMAEQEKLKMQIQQELQSQQVEPGVEENMAQEELGQIDKEVAMPQEELDEIDPATTE
jgi:hypothetical protein